MEKALIHHIVETQRAYFMGGNTLDKTKRRLYLKKLYNAIIQYQGELEDALKKDLGKSAFESDMCEIRLTLSEISYMLKHLNGYCREKTVWTPLSQFASRSFKMPSPYGVVLVMSPWNYPVLLTLEPLCDALAAGNTVVIKSSAYSAETTRVLKKLVENTFPRELVSFVDGGRDENQALLEENFDYIFFTGSKSVGKLVMEKASKHLTPVTLELGGKSPVIVMRDADIKLSAKRLVFGKYLNLGQTCVAPDYVLVDEDIKEEFVSAVVEEIKKQFGTNAFDNPDYGKIINEKHYKRIVGLIDYDKVFYGGKSDDATLTIEPTVMVNVNKDDKVMQEEIFGPLMPILTYRDINEALSIISKEEHPLAFYIFSKNIKRAKSIMRQVGFGGGCINDVIIHLATSEMGFGGFRASGMGSYHGKAGFDTFTHYKSIVDKKRWIDLPMRYQAYTKFNHKLINFFLK